MKRLLILLLLFASALHAQQQNFPGGSGGGLTQVAALPGTCNLGVLYQLTASPYGIFSCPQTNVLQKVDKGSSNTIDPVAFGVKGGGQLWIDGLPQTLLRTLAAPATTARFPMLENS